MDYTKEPPEFTNSEGARFWVNHDLTQYARQDSPPGNALPDAVVFVALAPNSTVPEYVFTRGQDYIAANTSLEAIAVRIDMERLTKKENTNT